jgi:hypothetical protein
MRRLALSIGLVSIVALALVPSAGAAEPTELQGKWWGTLEPSEGSVAKPEEITLKVNRAETKGTWSISPSCHGKLVLQSISNGFHHYERIAARGIASGCNAGGVDCLWRNGSQVEDIYVSANGTENGSGLFDRKR